MKDMITVFLRLVILVGSLVFISGCASQQSTAPLPEKLEVTITSDKKQVKINEPIKVTAEVKFGHKDISEDTKIEFEIIENGVSVGSVNPENEGNGKYSIETMFLVTGQHQVVAHVYYKEFHEMPILSLDLSE